MKKMKITALLLALIMLLQPVLVSADAAGVSLEDYMGFINNAQNYGLIDSAYEYYVQQLEGKTVDERYQTLKSWHEGLLGDLFYENFIAYYEKAHAGENLVCVCGAPCEYGTIAHTNPACQWYFGNLPADEQAQIVAGLGEDARAEYLACLPTVEQELTADNGITVQGDLPVGAKLMAKEAAVNSALSAIVDTESFDGEAEVKGYDISVEWNGYEWQPKSAVTITLPGIVSADLTNPVADVYHLLDHAAAIDENSLISTDEALMAAYAAEVAAAAKAGVTGVAYTVQSSAFGNTAVNADGSVSFATGSFSDYYVYVGNLNTNETLDNNEVHNLYMVPGTTLTMRFPDRSSNGNVAGDANGVTADTNSTTITFEATDAAVVGSNTVFTATWDRTVSNGWWDTTTRSYSATINVHVIDKIRVYVYVAGNAWRNNVEFQDLIKLYACDQNGYFPAGEIQLDASYLAGKTNYNTVGAALINSESDWEKLLAALGNMDTSVLTGTNGVAWSGNGVMNFETNNQNLVADYLDQAEYTANGGMGSQKTALFRWNDTTSYGYTDQSIHYHLDLNFNTKKITFITGNNGINSGAAQDGTTVDSRAYITGSEIQPPRNLYIPEGYQFMGYYEDADFTIPWDGIGTPLNEDQTVYIKITEKENVVIHYVPVGNGTVSLDNEAVNPNTGNPQGSTATAGADSRFVGWYSDEACTKQVSTDAHYVPQKVNGEHVAATYYAKFELMTGDLVINKTVQDSTFTSDNRTFTFTVNGEEKTMTVPSTTKTGTVTFTGLVAGDYTVTESHDGQYATTMGNTNGTTTTVTINAGQTTTLDVVNTANAKMDVEVTKTWVDNNNNLGKRPPTITVYLMNGSTQVQSAEITGDKQAATWTHTFTGVDKFDANGQEITYTVHEANVPAFYNKTAQSGLEVTNSVNVGSLMISKKVIDEHHLYTDTVRTFSFKIKQGNAFIQENGADKVWTVAIDTLENNAEQTNRLTVAELQPGEYTVEELPYNGYVATQREVKVTVAAGVVVEAPFENTVKTVNIPVTKTWEDLNDKYKVRPARITVALTAKYADGTAADSKYNKSITIDATTDWKREFQNVAIYDANGVALTYAVTETLAANAEFYTIPEIAGVDPKDEKPQIAITNSIKLGSLTITKTVVDPSGKYADELTFEFTVTGAHYNKKHTVTVKKDNGYTHSVTIPQLLIGKYTVTETVPDNYDLTSVTVGNTAIENGGEVAITYDNAPQTTTVTFTNTVKTVDIPVTKIWVDESNKLGTRPDSITLTLNGKVGETAVVTKTQQLTAANAVNGNANQWEFTFEKLPVYTADGDLITYTVDEAAVKDYEKSVKGYVITNTLLSTTLTITKAGCNETLDAGQSFLFRVTSMNGVDLIIAINGNGTEIISDLLVGDVVTVTEIEGWSWRYTGAAQTITLVDGRNTVTITNTRDNPYWLDGDCYAENNFAVQGN